MDIGVVIVTYNRRNDLEKALLAYENQIKQPKYIIVVNNNSMDGTKEFLEEWEKEESSIEKYIINLSKNLGGSGGFYSGLKKSLDLDCEWIWVADDDAYPDSDALLTLEKFYENNNINFNEVSAICGAVINNNKFDLDHRRRIKLNKFSVNQNQVPESEYKNEFFEIDLFSYVGTVISKSYMKQVGITEKDYFIYCDDTEHSLRLSKVGKILCVPKIRVVHDVDLQNRDVITWKNYYGLRNNLLMYKKHFPKRYFYYEYIKVKIKMMLRMIIKNKDPYNKLAIEALKAAKKDDKNLHEIYKPGWKC